MAVGTVAGSKLFIGISGAAIPSPDVSSPDVWIEIKPVRTLGDVDQNFAAITVESVGDGDSYDLKGVRRYPNFEITLNQDDTDPGQIVQGCVCCYVGHQLIEPGWRWHSDVARRSVWLRPFIRRRRRSAYNQDVDLDAPIVSCLSSGVIME